MPATDASPFLDACLASIAAAADGPDRVIVIDQPGMSVVDARNHGASRSTAEVLVFIDSDVLVHADAFTRIRAAFASDQQLSALIGSYDDSPAAPGAISGFRNLLHHHVCLSTRGSVATFWTGLGAVRREAFDLVGGFDDDLRWPHRSRDRRDYMADVALGMRLADGGHRIVLDPAIQGTHLKHWTLTQMVYTDFFLRGIPWVRLLLRGRDTPAHLNLGWRHRVSALVSLLGARALLNRRTGSAAALAAVQVALNRPFYALLLRRRGPTQATAGIFLHMVHHLTSLASLFTGVAIHLGERPEVRPTGPALVRVRVAAAEEPVSLSPASAEPARNGASHPEQVTALSA